MHAAPSSVRARTRVSYAADRDLVTRSVVASTLVGSAVIHGTVAGEHFSEWVLAGAFFIGVQAVELVLALVAVYAWSRRAAVVVVVSGGVTLAVWLLSRTVGMPVGPEDFRVPEPVGVPDMACVILELMSVLAAGLALRAVESSAVRVSPRGMAVAGTAVWAALVLTIWGGAPTVLGAGDHPHGSQGTEAGGP